MSLRRIPIRRAANRHNLFMGGDREMVMMCGLVAVALIFSAMTWYATVFGVSLWAVGLALLRQMAKADPRMRAVYMRSRRYVAYYPARSTPFRDNPPTQATSYQ